MQMTVRTDRTLLRATARSTRYLHIELLAPTAPPRANRVPVHIALVLDRSGSMDGARKFALAQQAVEESLRMLRAEDRFTLVVYDTQVDVLMPSTLATPDAKRTAMERLAHIGPRGGTDLYDGWMTGVSQLMTQLDHDRVNRVLLLTDGLANAGVTEPSALITAAESLRARGIATSTFGVGEDFDEVLMRDIARASGGQCYFIESPTQIVDVLTSELGEALEIVRRHVMLQIALPPGVEGELLNRYRTTHAVGDNELRVDVGDLTSSQATSFVVRLTFPTDREGARTSARITVSADATPSMDQEIAWTYAPHADNDVQPRNVIVDRAVATQYAGRARAEATEHNRRGDYRAARRVLEATARRIREYAREDPELDALWRALMAEADEFSREMNVMQRKEKFYSAEAIMSNRQTDGKAKRR